MSNFDCAAFATVAKTYETFQELEQSVSAIVNNDLQFRIIAAKCTSSFHFAFTNAAIAPVRITMGHVLSGIRKASASSV